MDFAQQILNGLTVGSIYALVALGFSIVYGALGLVNFGHGQVLMAGTFVTLALTEFGLPVWLAGIGGIAAGAILALILEEVAVRPVLHANLLIPMMTTLGIGLIYLNFAELRFGSGLVPFPSFFGQGFVSIGGLRMSTATFVTLGTTIVALVAFAAFLKYTRPGFAIRAVAQNITAARLMGIPVTRTIMLVYAMGGALGVVGGILFSNAIGVVFVTMGFPLLIKGFAAAVVGGIGNLQGAVIGGLVIGIFEALLGPLVGSYRDAIAFALLIVFLLIRPAGLLGARIQERV